MKKYNEEYYSVVEKRTGRKIADCDEWSDARMLLHMDPQNRQITKNKFLMDQVINVTSTTDKQLTGQLGLPAGQINQLEPHKIRLPEGQQQPVKV
jgi:hypothetical protein